MKRLSVLLAFLLIASGAFAQRMNVLGAGGPFSAVTPSYTGPGDIVSSATAWYGLRGYSAAYATPGTGKSVNVRRASDNATQDIVILTNGNLDTASYNTFVGTDATASCTISGTAMSCSGASATIHVNDPVTGVGITNPCVVTVTNGSTTATASIAGTSTSCGTVGVAETVTFQVAGFTPEAYDQSGNTNHALQATAGRQPQLLPIAANGSPTIFFNGGNNFTATLSGGQNIPFTFSSVHARVAAFTSDQALWGGASFFSYLKYTSTTGQLGVDCGNTGSVLGTASNNILHATQAVCLGNAGNSTLNIDGTSTTAALASGNGVNANVFIGQVLASTWQLQGYISEIGLWPSGFTSPQQTSVQLNQKAYWGTP